MITSDITGNRIKKYLESGKRFDGRAPEKFRELIIEKNISKKAEGSVRVKLGKTEVIVGVKLGVSEPYADSPNKGNLMVTAEMLPLSSPRIELGRPAFPAIELGRVIDRGIRESGFIDVEKLVIKEGEKVWTVFVDIYTINDDGNLLDAAGIGAVAALKIAKLPKYDMEAGKVLYGEESGPVPITDITPIAITVHKLGNSLIVDPTREEEDTSEARLTVGSSNGLISSMQKGNASTFSAEQIAKATEMVDNTWKDLSSALDKQLQ
jgi:exosome complex component RRP42